MLPYIRIPPLHAGPFTFHAFGLLVAIGVIFGTYLANWRAKVVGYDLKKLSEFIGWVLVSGFFLSHALDVVFYHPDQLLARPWAVFLVWESLSSFGGFVGAVIGALLWRDFRYISKSGGIGYFKRRKRRLPALPFLDHLASVFAFSWIFGRMGCAVVHDHPGAITTADRFLSVAYPAGASDGVVTSFGPIDFIKGSVPRWDMGLLEMLFSIVLSMVLVLMWHRKAPVGSYLVLVCLAYTPVRFAFDFLRIEDGANADPRYAGLTFAQWCCVAVFAYGIHLWVQVARWAREGIDPGALLRVKESADEQEPAEALS